MSEEVKRNANGFVIPRDPRRIPKGNLNPKGYADSVGKNNPAPGTTKPSGENLYATDTLTLDWWDTHERPEEQS